MEINILQAVVKHLNKFVGMFVPEETHYLLSLDGNGSRNGFEWGEDCEKSRREVVVSKVNTSQCLQPTMRSNDQQKVQLRDSQH